MVTYGALFAGLAFGAGAGTGIGEAASSPGGGGWITLAAGSATAIVVACIGLYATIRRRRTPEDMVAEASLTLFHDQTVERFARVEQRLTDLEAHVRPWPKAPR